MMLQTGKISNRFEKLLMNGSDEMLVIHTQMLRYFNINIYSPKSEPTHTPIK